jgi:pimeloyl-ACP methyl ester carboxylesterase
MIRIENIPMLKLKKYHVKTKTTKIDNISIRYSDTGKGFPIVLLHGYLESIDIWGQFSVNLSENFRVIAIDIPGHGCQA